MKKLLYLSLLILGAICISCEKQRPKVNFQSGPLVVGDSALYEVLHATDVDYSYSETRDETTPVFSISNFQGKSTTIYALNPGIDTLFVGVAWSEGMFPYGLIFYSIIEVIEK